MDQDRIGYLWEKFNRGTASPEEEDELINIIDENESAFRSYLESMLTNTIPLQDHSDLRLKAVLDRINALSVVADNQEGRIQYITETEKAPVRKIAVRYRWWAAAAVVVLAASWWFVANVSRDTKPDTSANTFAAENDVPPGGNKAILTLGNGQTIILDTASPGTLAVQGGANIIKLDNGQIQYSESANAAGEIYFNTMSTPRGGMYKLILPDGTQVWLNSASSITYPTAFAGKQRSVSVTGEVYFEVSPDKSKPFRVSARDMSVEVLGTHFNINAYDDELSINTTLLEGSVKVSDGSSAGQSLVLTPGQQAQVHRGKEIRLNPNADTDQVMAWKNGLFFFDKADIQSVMRQLERWYDVEVVYAGEIPKDKFGGNLPRDSNISVVLKALEQSQVHFRIEGKKIIVLP